MRRQAEREILLLLLIGALLSAAGYAQGPAAGPTETEKLKENLAIPERHLAAEEEREHKEAATLERKNNDQSAAQKNGKEGSQNAAGKQSARADFDGTELNISNHQRSVPGAFALNLLSDQRAFWTGPLRVHLDDASWIVPFSAATAALVGSDTSIEKILPTRPRLIQRSHSISKYGVGSLVGAAGGLYLLGNLTQNEHARETGFLGGEALANSFLNTEVFKVLTGRERPLEGNGKGQFWQGGSSFPSEHAAAAWSLASVIAHEYPGPMTKLLAYGTASAISVSRVLGRNHFTSDAVVGSALGWYIGRQVYRAHHNPELDGAQWGTFVRSPEETKPEDMGSPYVPLDTWIYPALDRLAALGYVQSGFAGMRPWTRMECARLLEEAGGLIQQDDWPGPEAGRLYQALAQEFSPEIALLDGGRNLGAAVESIYTRFTGISGTPLIDGYHFGQTIANDYGRPYARGFNLVTGVSGRAQAGPLAFYLRGEYQHAPAAPPVPDDVRAAIAVNDNIPLLPAAAPADINRFRFLDSYVTFGFKGFRVSAGKQSLWWGPGHGGPLLLSDNAEPIAMVRISRAFPTKLPSILSWLGPVRSEFFFGKLEGHHFPPRPFIYGQKVSFKPTPNLELGFSRTGIFAGEPQPLTWGTFWNSFTSNASGNPDPRQKPGDRRGGFDFSYRIPGLRKWLVLYTDSLVDDDPSPLAAPRRAAMNPGIYLPQIPKLRRLDLRVEAVYTDPPTGRSVNGQFIYWEFIYRDSHTNNGNLMGSWIGREGKGIQAWTTCWLSPRSTIEIGWRAARVAKDFLEGGFYQDFGTRAELLVRPELSITGSLQYERWNFPLLSTTHNSNFMASAQLTYWPRWTVR
jgi:membrane-associated phospholipid phosphatase